ncbi:MAG: GNAT family N-acetyltransferase [Bacteroidales bacterium]|jgi:hypothetical protein|nr:GNAT family N-acetyltransferase [Bacteroidales bacterium]
MQINKAKAGNLIEIMYLNIATEKQMLKDRMSGWGHIKHNQDSISKRISEGCVLTASILQSSVGTLIYDLNFNTSESSVNFLGRKPVFIEGLFIYPSYRNKGISTELIKRLHEEAVINGYDSIAVSVAIENTKGFSFFMSRGFDEVGIDNMGFIYLEKMI